MVQRGLGDGRGLMDFRKTVALYDIVVALTEVLQYQYLDPF
jgi:hypothetical protein